MIGRVKPKRSIKIPNDVPMAKEEKSAAKREERERASIFTSLDLLIPVFLVAKSKY